MGVTGFVLAAKLASALTALFSISAAFSNLIAAFSSLIAASSDLVSSCLLLGAAGSD